MAAEEPDIRLPASRQAWRHVAFLSWPVPAAALRERLPARLELDTHEERAWLSLVAFTLDVDPAPGLPLRREGDTQVNLRTYVRGPDGRRGIHDFSSDVTSRAPAAGARALGVPYRWARGSVEPVTDDRWRYRVERRAERAGAEIELDLDAWLPGGAQTVLDRFLTQRFHVYRRLGPALLRAGVEHPPGTLRRASAARFEESLTRAAGLPGPRGKNVVAHWSEGVEVELGVPVPVVGP